MTLNLHPRKIRQERNQASPLRPIELIVVRFLDNEPLGSAGPFKEPVVASEHLLTRLAGVRPTRRLGDGEFNSTVLGVQLIHEEEGKVTIHLPGFRLAVAAARNQTGNDDVPVHVASDSLPKGSDG